MHLRHPALLLPYHRLPRRLQPGLAHKHLDALARERRALEVSVCPDALSVPDSLP